MQHRTLGRAGVNFVGTADMYGWGASEEIVAKALKGRRGNVMLATKAHLRRRRGPERRAA